MADTKLIRNSVPLANPDWAGIREALKEYLKGQEELADYDFDGSVAAVLIDKLAYDSHFKAFYLNLVGNEAFLSTAVKRDSVVERAKLVGYTPRSARCSRANVYVSFDVPSLPSAITLQRGASLFGASYNDISFNYSVVDTISVPLTGSGYIVPDLEIVEGRYTKHNFNFLSSSLKEGFVLPNQNIDTTTLRVKVTEKDSSNVTYSYDPFDDFISLGDSDRVFFVEEVDGGYIKVSFGDGVIGKKPSIGDNVEISYFISNLDDADGAYNFRYTGTISGVDSAQVITASASSGGASPESIQSIKFTAPKSYDAQNRAVTAEDYEYIIKKKYDNVEDVVAWGGETNIPPRYGYVLISVKPKVGTVLSNTDKQELFNLLKKYNVTSITPEIVDPDYTYVLIDIEFNYDTTRTELGVGDLEALTKNTTLNYIDNSIEKFDKALRNSVLTRLIDTSEYSIINSNANIRMQKRLFPIIGTPLTQEISFNAVIVPGSITSTPFTYEGLSGCTISTSVGNPSGLSVVRIVEDTVVVVEPNIGSIDLATGKVNITELIVQAIPNSAQYKTTEGIPFVGIVVTPDDEDVFPSFNQILTTEGRYVTSKGIAEKNYRP